MLHLRVIGHVTGSGLALFLAALILLAVFGPVRGAFGQEPGPAVCKTAILIWVPVAGAEVPILRADREYVDRATCIVNKARREGAAEILEFRASPAGSLPPSRCAGIRETLASEGVAAGDELMSAAAINEAYGEDVCPPDTAADAGG